MIFRAAQLDHLSTIKKTPDLEDGLRCALVQRNVLHARVLRLP